MRNVQFYVQYTTSHVGADFGYWDYGIPTIEYAIDAATKYLNLLEHLTAVKVSLSSEVYEPVSVTVRR